MESSKTTVIVMWVKLSRSQYKANRNLRKWFVGKRAVDRNGRELRQGRG